MKSLALALLTITACAEDLPLDPSKPGLLRPGSVSSFTITPSQKTPKVTIRYHADSKADLSLKTPDGQVVRPDHEDHSYYFSRTDGRVAIRLHFIWRSPHFHR